MGVPNFNVKNKYDLKSTLLPVYLLFTSRKANKTARLPAVSKTKSPHRGLLYIQAIGNDFAYCTWYFFCNSLMRC